MVTLVPWSLWPDGSQQRRCSSASAAQRSRRLSPLHTSHGDHGVTVIGRVVAVLFVTLKLLLYKNQTMKFLDMRRCFTCRFFLLASDNPPVLGRGARVFWGKLNQKILFASAEVARDLETAGKFTYVISQGASS